MSLDEAASVWQTAHTIFLKNQVGRAQGINENAGGNGDSNHHLIWVADVRKLVPGELDTFLLDCVFGDSSVIPDEKSRRGATDALRLFNFALRDRPEVYADFHKMRRIVFE